MDFGGTIGERLVAYGFGALAGAVGVVIGSLASGSTVLAVIAAFIVVTTFSMFRTIPWVSPVASVGPQLGLLLALLTPGSSSHIWVQTAGWIAGSAVAIVAALVIFPRKERSNSTSQAPTRKLALEDSLRVGLAVSLAVLVAKLTGVEHGFWVAAVALCIASTHVQQVETARAAKQMTLGAVGGVAIAAVAIYLLPHAAIFVLLPIAAFWSKYESERRPFTVQLTYTPFAVFNLTLLQWPQHEVLHSFRLVDVAIGAGVAVVATVIVSTVHRKPAPNNELRGQSTDSTSDYGVTQKERFE